MKKKIFTFFLALVAGTGTVFAVSGTCGENLKWVYDHNVLTISGTGEMTNYDNGEEAPWKPQRTLINGITILNGVTSIGNSAFFDLPNLNTVTMPNSLASIGDNAFMSSTLYKVTIPAGVTSIGKYAFVDCTKLTAINVDEDNPNYSSKDGVLFDKKQTTLIQFPAGKNSTSYTIPNSVKTIGDEAFIKCTLLNSVTIPNSVKSIGNNVFQYCTGLTDIGIPNSVTSIGWSVFNDCSNLTEINVAADNQDFSSKNGVLFDKEKATILRYPCGKSGKYSIPNTVMFIADEAFETCTGLSSVIIPGGVTNIGGYAFYQCTGLTSITSRAITPPACGSECFKGVDKSIPLNVYAEALEAYKDTPGWNEFTNIQAICTRATGTCGADGDNLQWVLSCDSVLTIRGTGAMKDYGYSGGPWGSSNLKYIKSVVIEQGVTSVGKLAFYRCQAMTSVTMSGTVTSIGNSAFETCSALTSVTIPNSVTSIGDGAFSYCEALPSIEIPNSVTSIGKTAFEKCTALTSITMGNGVTEIGGGAFKNCTNLTEVYINDLAAWCGINCAGDWSNPFYYAQHLYLNKKEVTDLAIPDGVTSIGTYAFYGCTGLTSVTIDGFVTSIGKYAFAKCTEVTSVTIDAPITSIGSYAFFECTGLTSVTIGDDVTTIDGDGVFYKCSGMKTITIGKNVKKIGSAFLDNCTSLTSITCKAVTPPDGGGYFTEVDRSIPLYVPFESVKAYRNSSSRWNEFNTYYGDRCLLVTGTCEDILSSSNDSVTWSVSCDGVLYIGGRGAMKNYDRYHFSPWTSLVDHIVVEGEVTRIGNNAFLESQARTVTVCDSVKSIMTGAFTNCTKLETVHLGSGLKYFSSGLTGCSTVTSITCDAPTPPQCNDDAFEGLDKDIPVFVPEGTMSAYSTAKGWNYFNNIRDYYASGTCGDNLTWTLKPSGTLIISGTGDMTSWASATDVPWHDHLSVITSVVIEDGVTSIGGHAFDECNAITSIEIPQSVTSVGDHAFDGCSSLPAITLPYGITTIGEGTFSGCSSLVSITIPAGVTELKDHAFDGCTGLATIFCLPVTPPKCGEDCFGGIDKPSVTLYVPDESFNAYTVHLEWGAFLVTPSSECVLASGVLTKNNDISWRLSCEGDLLLEGTGVVPAIGQPYNMEWQGLSASVKTLVIGDGITEIGERTFGNLHNVEYLSLPNSLKIIGPYAFDWIGSTHLSTLIVPNSVTSIGAGAFTGVVHVSTIIVGFNVKTIGEYAFAECYKLLPDVICLAVRPPAAGMGIFSHQGSTVDPTKTLYVPAQSVSKYKAAKRWEEFTKILPLYEVPDTHIIASGICGNGLIWEIDSNGILTIRGEGAMDSWGKPNPAGAGKRNMPADDASAPWYPYHSEILYVEIEEGVESIGDNAFNGCTNIQSITCYAVEPPTCGTDAFGGIDPSGLLSVPEGSIPAYQTANQWQEFLEIQAIEQDTEDIPTILTNDAQPATKILYKGQIYILRGEKVYTLTGQEVK